MGIPFLYLVEKKEMCCWGRTHIKQHRKEEQTQFPLFQISLSSPTQSGSETQSPPWSCVAAQPWLSIPCPAAPVSEFTDVSSLCSQGCVGGSDSLCSLNNSGRSFWKDTGHAELPQWQSCCPRVISNANVCTLKPSRGGMANHFKLIKTHCANWVFEVIFHLFWYLWSVLHSGPVHNTPPEVG